MGTAGSWLERLQAISCKLQALILLARLEQFFDSIKAANRADIQIVAARRAVFPTEENDLQVQFVPAFFGEQLFEIGFGLLYIFAAAESPTPGQTMYVCINGESRHAEGLRHDYGGCFVAHARQCFEGREVVGHLPLVLFDEDFGEIGNSLRFARRQSARPDDVMDGLYRHLTHFQRVVGKRKELWRHFIDTLISTLGRKEYRHEQGVGVFVLERNGCFRVEAL